MRLNKPEGYAPPSRRIVAASLFTAGYALASSCAKAEPITTPADALITEDVTFAAAGGYQLPAYLARPRREGQGEGARATVIVVNEIFGIHAYIKDVCHRLAREGYVALAPDYFDRAGDPSTLSDWKAILAMVGAATFEQVMSDTEAALAWLATQDFCNAGKVGITGFCWGGKVVWQSAARIAAIKAGVAWYGRVAPENAAAAPSGAPWPVDLAASLRAPVLGLYGRDDQGIPVASVEAMRAALIQNGNPSGSEIIIYDGAGHGFHADYRDSYSAEAAADGWARALAWFRAHGVQ